MNLPQNKNKSGKFIHYKFTILSQTTVNPTFYRICSEMGLQVALGSGTDITT